MRRAILGSIAICLAGAGVCLAQPGVPPQGGSGTVPQPPASVQAATAAEPAAAPPGCATCAPAGPAVWLPGYVPAYAEPHVGDTYPLYFWASIESLIWAVKDAPLPVPLVTTLRNGSPITVPTLANPNTVVLYGAQDVDFDTAYGMKFACGVFDPKLNLGLEGSVFRLEDLVSRFTDRAEPQDNRVLVRPFYDLRQDMPDAVLVAFPGFSFGGINITSSNRFWGAEGNLATTIYSNDGWVIDLLGGFRYFDLKEGLVITDSVHALPGGVVFFNGNPVSGGIVTTQDNFDTQNRFYGGQIGFRTETYLGRLFASFKALAAIGTNHTSSTIRGSTTLFRSGQILGQNLTAGTLAVQENSVRISQDSATVIPIFEVTVGYQLTSWLRAYAGYTFIYWGNVTRPGDQIQPFLDSRSMPTLPTYDPNFRGSQPRNPFDKSDFWAQGLNFGLAVRF
jgi:hypothetical protein